MAQVTREPQGKQDIKLWYGDSETDRDFTRDNDTGYTQTLNKLDWVGIDIRQVYGGGVIQNSTALAAAITAIGASDIRNLWFAPIEWTMTQSHTFTSNMFLHIPPGCSFDTDMSIRSASYIWTASGSGTNEYYCQATGGTDPSLNEPSGIDENGTAMTAGTAGSLSAGEWDWGDNDTLGYSTVYVRLTDNTDPDSKTADYVLAGYTLTIYSPENIIASPRQQIFSGVGAVAFSKPGKYSVGWRGVTVAESAANNNTYLGYVMTDILAGSEIYFPPGSYSMADQWAISKACKISAYKATLSWASDTSADRGILVTASNVKIYGIELNGPQHASAVTTQSGIYAYGADSSNYITGLVIKDCKIYDWGYACIRMRYVQYFEIEANTLYDGYTYGALAASCLDGRIDGNIVYGIQADGTPGTGAWGIAATKHNGTEAANPVCQRIIMSNNIIKASVWQGLDTHGGQYITFDGNQVFDTVAGIGLARYDSTAGSEMVPVGCVVSNNIIRNDHGVGEIVSVTQQQSAISLTGHITSSTWAFSNVITGNTIEGHGDQDGTWGSNGAIYVYYTKNTVISGNTIRNSGRFGIASSSNEQVLIANNVIDTVTGTSATAATGTITFADNPSNGDTITLNGAVYTFVDPAAPATDYEIDIKASLALTLDEMIAVLNASTGQVTSKTTDGRVSSATYTEDGVSVLTITFDTIGKSGEYYTLAASADTVSAANLVAATEDGSCGIAFDHLSGAGAGEYNSGLVSGNIFNLGAYPGIQMNSDDIELDFIGNKNLGTGPLYDLRGSGSHPNSGAGYIDIIGMVSYSYDPSSIDAAGSETFYIPTPGGANAAIIFITATRTLDGLTMSYKRDSNYNAVELKLDNPSAGAVDLGSTTFYVTYGKYAARQ